MAKHVENALKVFVAVATLGYGLVVFGIIEGTALLAYAGLTAVSTLVGGLLSKGIEASRDNFGTKVSTRNATAPRQIVYGQCRVGGTITHIETSGIDNSILSMVVVLAGHEIESLDGVLINDTLLTTTASGNFQAATNSKFFNSDNDNAFGSGTLIRYKFKDGSQTTADSDVTGNSSLTGNDKFTDVAYVFIQMVFDSEAFGGGIPNMAFIIKGKKVYDPRESGHTFGDESTYEWSNNPALCVLDYITNTTYGLKATSDEFLADSTLGSFKTAANTCETQNNVVVATTSGTTSSSQFVDLVSLPSNTLIDVGHIVTGTGISGSPIVLKRTQNQIKLSSVQTLSSGTTLTFKEPAYTANGFTNMTADGTGVLEGLLSSCAGKLSYINGKFVMFAGATVSPQMTINDDNLLQPIQVQTKQTSGETFNKVKSIYIDANNNYVATDTPTLTPNNPDTSNTYLSEDTPTGESSANYEKILEIQLPFTDSVSMAERLGNIALLHTRQQTSISVLCNIAYMQLQPFDWVYVNNSRLGYTNKVFEVISTNLEVIEDDGVQILATRLALKEIQNAVYTFATSDYENPIDEGTSVSTGDFSVSAPTLYTATASLGITGYDIDVNWTNIADDNIQGTEVQYGTTSGTYVGSLIVGKGISKEKITGLKANTTYYIVLRHFSSNNVFSANTNEMTVVIGDAPISYSTGSGVGSNDSVNILGKNLTLNLFKSTSGGEDNENYTFLSSGNGALGGITSFQNSDAERVQLFFGEDIGGDWTNKFISLDANWDLGKGGSDGNSTGITKFIISGSASDESTGSNLLSNTIATFEIQNADGSVATPYVTLANTTITGSTTTPIVEVSQGSAPSTTTDKLYNVGGTLYWNGVVVDTGAGDITGVTITTSGQSGLTGGASFSSGDATFTLAIASTINGSKTFSDDVVVQGDLTVQGTTTTIDTTNLDVADKNITLNYGTGDTSANANGAGITIQDAVNSTTDATILWDATNDRFDFSHGITLPDNGKAIFGAGSDLQIYHNGSASYIDDSGDGSLYIRGNNLYLQKYTGETYLAGISDSSVYLYYNGLEKLRTLTGGVDITGTLTSDGLTVNLGSTGTVATFTGATSNRPFTLKNYDAGISGSGYIFDAESSFGAIKLQTTSKDRLTINNGGDISFYEDTGTTAKLFWDASAERLGIGTVSPSSLLEISADSDDGTSAPSFLITNASTTLNDGAVIGTIEFKNSDASGSPPHSAKIQGIANASDERTTELAFSTAQVGTTTEVLRITSDGKVGISTDSPNTKLEVNGSIELSEVNDALRFANSAIGIYRSSGNILNISGYSGVVFNVSPATYNSQTEVGRFNSTGDFYVGTTQGIVSSSSVSGVNLLNSGYIGAARNGTVAYFNRQTTDGNIVEFRKDGSTRGSIGVFNDGLDRFYIVGDNGLKFKATDILPCTSTGANNDDALDLGASNVRFKDLHLSGTANFGSLSDGTITITGFVDEDNMSSDSATLLPTQQSVKAYVDSQVSGVDTLAEILAIGNTTGGTDIAVSTGDDITFVDNAKAIFGTGSDFEIYHDQDGPSYIRDKGSSDLVFTSNGSGFVFKNDGETETLANMQLNGAVTLYYDNSPKIATTSTGVDITGQGKFTDLTNGGLVHARGLDASLFLDITSGNNAKIYYDSGDLEFKATNPTAVDSSVSMKIAQNRDISFYEDTGTTAKFFWDASTQRLGIGNVAPNNALDVTGNISLSGNVIVPTGKGLTSSGEFLNLESTRYLRYKKTGDSHNMLSIDGTNDTFTFSTTGSTDILINSSGGLEIKTQIIYDNSTFGTFDWTSYQGDNGKLAWTVSGTSGAEMELSSDGSDYTNAVLTVGGQRVLTQTAGINLTGNLGFNDNVKALFGTNHDLEIYHDSNNSYIKDSGTGNLLIQAETSLVLEAPNGQNYLTANKDGNVSLYYSGSNKIYTTNTGVNVTGTVVSDGLEVDGTAQFSGNIAGEQGITATFSEFNVGTNVSIGIEVSNLTTTSAVETSRILGSASTYRTFKVMVQATSGTSYHATEILLTHDGTTVYMTEYGTIFTGTSLATFDADISSGNVRLLVDPNQSASTTFKFSLSAIKV